MKDRHDNKWLWPPIDYWIAGWGLLIIVPAIVSAVGIFLYCMRLVRAHGVGAYLTALLVATAGIALIFYAKLPLYMKGRPFTFGIGAISAQRRLYYQCGYLMVIVAAGIWLTEILAR